MERSIEQAPSGREVGDESVLDGAGVEHMRQVLGYQETLQAYRAMRECGEKSQNLKEMIDLLSKIIYLMNRLYKFRASIDPIREMVTARLNKNKEAHLALEEHIRTTTSAMAEEKDDQSEEHAAQKFTAANLTNSHVREHTGDYDQSANRLNPDASREHNALDEIMAEKGDFEVGEHVQILEQELEASAERFEEVSTAFIEEREGRLASAA